MNFVEEYSVKFDSLRKNRVLTYPMFEFMYPQHLQAHFQATGSGERGGIEGISVREMLAYTE